MNSPPYVLILAGGAGTRFWPASRERMPKQFLDITGSGKTLIRQAVDRFLRFIPLENIYIITHSRYATLVKEQIPELHAGQIILEPSRNNTAPSIALASLKLSKLHPEGLCIVASADHVIQQENTFEKIVKQACQHTEQLGSLITLSIKPTRPDTGYGYIEMDQNDSAAVKHVKSFREKPDSQTAQQYLNSGSFAWNAGIFVWKLSAILDAFKNHSPQIYNILSKGMDLYNTDAEKKFIESEYPKSEITSVDYAILERADNVYTIPCDIGWSDLGTWNSLYDQSPMDKNKNVILSTPVHLEDTTGSLVQSKDSKLLVIKGLKDYIIVDTDDCLLIFPKSDEQSIKALKEKLKEKGLDKFL